MKLARPEPHGARRSVQIAGGALIGAILLAIALHFIDERPGTLEPEPVVPRAVGRFDPWIGWGLLPNARAVSRRLDPPIEYRINSKGVRADREHAYGSSRARRRVVLIGDSHTFGFGVPIEQHFSSFLEDSLPECEVINLGVSGYGVDQQLLALRYEGLRYCPNLVIAYVPHYADHRHMHTRRFGKHKPRFRVVDDELVLTDFPVTNPPASGAQTGATQTAEAERDFRDALFRAKLNRLGARIVAEMQATASAAGAEFLLVTKMPRLAELAEQRGIAVLDVARAMDDPAFHLPDGLKHMDGRGNAVLAREIVRRIEAAGLLAAPAPREAKANTRIAVRVSRAQGAPAAKLQLLIDGRPVGEPRELRAARVPGDAEWLRFELAGAELPSTDAVRCIDDESGSDPARGFTLSALEIDGTWVRPSEGERSGGGPGADSLGLLTRGAELSFDLERLGISARE